MADVVKIQGGGVAACCCAALLGKAGFGVSVEQVARTGSPTLMLNEQTQLLFRDVFGCQELFSGATRIGKRVVAWGENVEPVELPHAGIVISEAQLLHQLSQLVAVECTDVAASTHSWVVPCSRASMTPVAEYRFGSRVAATNAVVLKPQAKSETCWVEATRKGWLFLIPVGDGLGSLISVGVGAASALDDSRLVASQISELGVTAGSFPAYPRLVTPLCGPRWIASGSAAVGFDPIAGEGAGHAIRQGILAAAVIKAAREEAAESELLAHYSSRMLSGFRRHLAESAVFYKAEMGEWWKAELDEMRKGLDAAREHLMGAHTMGAHTSAYRLVGFELERIAEGAA